MSNAQMAATRRGVVGLALGLGLLLAGGAPAAQAQAQDWPSRPVTMVVPFAPGASNDTFTRAISQILSKKFNQPFVVENRAGAGGFTGANAVSRSPADGYTFLEIPNSIVGFKPILNVDMDPLVNLTPVGLLARSPSALVVNSSLPVKTVQEFIAYAKANPDTTFYGFGGIGATQHQDMELFKARTGIKIKGVNYKSSSDAQTDLVAGRVQAMIITVASTLGQIEAGQLRLIAYTDGNYPPESPKAPTMAEAGVTGMDKAQIWWGVFGPANLPAQIAQKMNAAINESLKDPTFVALLAKSGATPAPVTPEQFVQIIKDEKEKVQEFIKTTDIKAN
jgi:tripartite-type tricarboxylate transporter receptor subunit TctC